MVDGSVIGMMITHGYVSRPVNRQVGSKWESGYWGRRRREAVCDIQVVLECRQYYYSAIVTGCRKWFVISIGAD